MPKNTCFLTVLIKAVSKKSQKTLIITKLDEIFQMVILQINYLKKKNLTILFDRGTLIKIIFCALYDGYN